MKDNWFTIVLLVICFALLIILRLVWKTPQQICEENGGDWIETQNIKGCWYPNYRDSEPLYAYGFLNRED